MPDEYTICVLISGGGTTLQNLIDQSRAGCFSPKIAHVISSNPDAGGLEFARDAGIPVSIFPHRQFDEAKLSDAVFQLCRQEKINLVVMGGFLRKLTIPGDFQNRIVNIHPSLIPAFCGKGFYGDKVHQGVLDYGAKLSGCTVHFVDNHFDHGPIIAQRSVPVLASDSPARLAKRVFEQECQLYPLTIELIARGRVQVKGRIVSTEEE